MDACDPGVNVRNLKRLVKQNTGLELDLTREQICDAYSSIQDGKLPLPPMVLSKDGKYMLDRKSPLTGNDFEILFGSDSTVSQLKRVARKAGLASYKDMTKAEMVEAIESTLESKNIREPIRLHVSAQRAVRKVSVNNNNNYPNNLNVNNVNGNGVRNNTKRVSNNNNNNLGKIANESKNLNRNGNRNGETRNGNRNGETRNGNRSGNTETRNRNGNRNARPPVNRTTARYVNAMLRRPNSRRNEDLAKVLAAARTTGNGSTQNLSRVIEALRKKPSTDGSTASMLNKLMRAKTSGNSDALRRAMKEIEILKRKGPVASVNDKQQKLAELEKYAVRKASKLGNQRLQFMNEAQTYVNGYKNGRYNSNGAKARISARYEEIYKKRLKAVNFSEGVSNLQRNTKSIGNTKIKSEAMERLEEYKKTGSQSAMNDIIQLKKLDEQLGNKQEKVDILFNKNRRHLNAARDEVLKTKPYNLKSGLAKLDKIIEEKEKEIREKKREVNINTLINNAKYGKLTQNEKNKARRAYMNGGSTLNDVRGALNKLVTIKKRGDNINNLTKQGKYKNLNANAKNKAKENYINGKLTLNQVKEALNKAVGNNSRNVNKPNATGNNNNKPPLSLNNIFAGKLNNIPSLTNANRKKLNKEKNNNIKTKLNNAEVKLKNLKKQLATGGLTNNKKRELESKIKNEMKKRETLETQLNRITTNRNTLANQLKQSQNRSESLGLKVAEAKKSAEASIKEANTKVKELENQLTKRANLTPNQVKNLKNQINKAKANAASVEEKANARVAAAQAAAQESMKALRLKANKEVANARAEANAASAAASKAEAAASKAELNVLARQNMYESAQAKLEEKRANLNSLTEELKRSKTMSENQRSKLEQQLITQGRQVTEAENASRKAKENAKAATETSQRLVAEASQAASNASQRAAEAEQAKVNALAERETALGNKKEANRLRAAANAERKVAQQEAVQSREIANKANAEAKRIAAELKSGKERSEAEISALRNQMQKAFNTRQIEMQKQINAIKSEYSTYKKGASKRIQALEVNRTSWKANAHKKANNLGEKVKEINRIQSNIARLKKELNNSKTASNTEKAALKTQYNREMKKLTNQRNALNQELKAASLGRYALETKLEKLQATKTISNKQINELQKKLADTQNNLRRTATTLNSTRLQMQGRISGMTQGQQRIQAQLKQARQSARNYKAAARRNVGPQFNATGAFQNMGNKLAANRNAWKRAGGRWQGAQSGVKAQENLRVAKNALYTIINSHRKNGNWTIGSGMRGGWKRQTLRHKVNTATNMNQIKEARKLVAAAKKEKNFKIGRGKMDPILANAGTGFSFTNTPTQPRVSRTQLLVQNNRKNAKNAINALKGIGNKTKRQLKGNINRGINPNSVLRNARVRNARAGGPAANARRRAQSFAS